MKQKSSIKNLTNKNVYQNNKKNQPFVNQRISSDLSPKNLPTHYTCLLIEIN